MESREVDPVDWWMARHISGKIGYLGNSAGVSAWTFLEVRDLIKPEAVILNVGVGTGRCTQDLKDQGVVEIHALDIVKPALDRVRGVIKKGYLTPDDLPADTFDLIVSYLVAQYMDDAILQLHIGHYVRSLKSDGVLALQFRDVDGAIVEGQGSEIQNIGMIHRTRESVLGMVESVGGSLLKWVASRRVVSKSDALDTLLHGIQIVRT